MRAKMARGLSMAKSPSDTLRTKHVSGASSQKGPNKSITSYGAFYGGVGSGLVPAGRTPTRMDTNEHLFWSHCLRLKQKDYHGKAMC